MSAELLTNFQPNSYETKTTVISRRATRAADEPAASLIGALASNCRKSPLLSCVMGATLVASMFNTILLSFVIKSLQLHDVSIGATTMMMDDKNGSSSSLTRITRTRMRIRMRMKNKQHRRADTQREQVQLDYPKEGIMCAS